MSRAIAIVFAKEVLENVRDRRVVWSAFFFGVLLAPIVFGITTTIASQRALQNQDEPLELAIIGAAQAPNLTRFLLENGVEAKMVAWSTQDAMQRVRTGTQALVLLIEAPYGEQLQEGEPAPLHLIFDSSDAETATRAERATQLLHAYGRQLASLRLLARGISPQVIQPLDLRAVDVATPASRSLLLLGMMTYFCLMAMLVGGFYLAIDTTAGERERGSLEPLLALPAPRAHLIIGKMLATSTFMAASLLLTLAAFAIVLRLVPLETLGMSANFGPGVFVRVFAVMLTFIPLGAGLMTVVASFTRSNREAQSWLSIVMFLPIAPIVFAVVTGVRASAPLMAIPSLSQHLLATSLMRGDPVPPSYIVLCTGVSLLVGVALMAVAVRLYKREALLG